MAAQTVVDTPRESNKIETQISETDSSYDEKKSNNKRKESNVIYQTIPQNLEAPDLKKSNIAKIKPLEISVQSPQAKGRENEKITTLDKPFPCCLMTIMVIYLFIFCAELLFVLLFWGNAFGGTVMEPLKNYAIILYSIQIVITATFLIVYAYYKLWIKWNKKQNYFGFMMMALIVTWLLVIIVIGSVYEGMNNSDISFVEVLLYLSALTFAVPLLLCLAA